MLSDVIGWILVAGWFSLIAFLMFGWNKVILPVVLKMQDFVAKVNAAQKAREEAEADSDG